MLDCLRLLLNSLHFHPRPGQGKNSFLNGDGSHDSVNNKELETDYKTELLRTHVPQRTNCSPFKHPREDTFISQVSNGVGDG